MTAAQTYIQVLLPVRLRWVPTYSSNVPLEPGRRVCVELGRRRYDGVVWRSLERPDLPPGRILPIVAVQDDLPDVTPEELRFWEFIATYYQCTLGEVYKAAYPLLKIRSEQTAADIQARLRSRIAKKEQELAGRHRESVMQRLRAERDELLRQLASLTATGSSPSYADRRPAPGKPAVATGAGRRETYLPAIREALDAGGQILVLSPEIAFCDSLETLLRPGLGEQLHVFHSGKTPVRRRLAAEALRSGAPAVILGTRSALFLPFRRLALVIIDEEQDPAYKQSEPAPRYQGRDTAVALAGIHGARVLLGAAVPSLETLLNLRLGKYTLLQEEAPADTPEIIDLPAERRKNGLVGTFSRKLIAAVLSAPDPVLFLRGWEKPDPLQEEIARCFPGRDIRVKTLNALKREGADGASLIAVLQADALIARDDFRADERALQTAGTLCHFAPRVLIQTAVPARFSGARSLDDLLAERRQFGFPPYTRLVEVRRQGSGEVLERHFLARDRSLAARKDELAARLPDGYYLDVDPID
jgi:Primosomal protein N'' (replication factor Y) - superfamily II helicase